MIDEALTFIVPIALKEVMEQLLPDFSRATGQSLHVVHMLNPEVPRHVASGALWDIAITNPSHVEEMIDAGSGHKQSLRLFARTPLAFARRGSGTNAPACTRAGVIAVLRDASDIALTAEGTSGDMFRQLTDELGVSGEVEPKLRPMAGGEPMAALVDGEVDLAALPLTNIVPIANVHPAAICPFDLEVHIDTALCLRSLPSARLSARAQALADWLLHADRATTLESLGAKRL